MAVDPCVMPDAIHLEPLQQMSVVSAVERTGPDASESPGMGPAYASAVVRLRRHRCQQRQPVMEAVAESRLA